MMSVWTKFRSALRAFRAAHSGNVALTFVFATLPIIALVGAAVDYSRANQVKVAMQGALELDRVDALEGSGHRHRHAVTNEREELFPCLIHAAPRPRTSRSTPATPHGQRPWSLARDCRRAHHPPWRLGINTIDLTSSTSTSKWGETRLRVALVLDNTGSMADSGKMPALQAATKSLLTQLQERRHRQWRRLCLDCSVREGRQSRRQQLEFRLDLLGHAPGRRQC